MRVFSYVVASDSGFAPNPFGTALTLACCKPTIRRSAAPGDWIVGLAPRGRRIVYAMRVTERLTFAEYWRDPRFRDKRPFVTSPDIRRRCGDNIYRPRSDEASPLSAHGLERWSTEGGWSLVQSVARGQGAVLDTRRWPEGIEWSRGLLELGVSSSPRCSWP